MTPNVKDILRGCAVALATPPSPDAGPDYAASRFGVVSMLIVAAANEADTAAAAAATENTDMRALFAEAASYDSALGGRLSTAAAGANDDLTVPALDAANADLRRLLIQLHERVEAAEDKATERKIVALYGRMARVRRMVLGG
jgi:hypothetical protein